MKNAKLRQYDGPILTVKFKMRSSHVEHEHLRGYRSPYPMGSSPLEAFINNFQLLSVSSTPVFPKLRIRLGTELGIILKNPLITPNSRKTENWSAEKMNAQSQLEKKCDLLQNRLQENLEKKHALELRINQEFEELKRLEISLEKRFEQQRATQQMSVKH
jgi:hypothetical protein